MIALVCYLSILTAILVQLVCVRSVCAAQGGGGVHEQHTDEFPACADQITLPTLFLSLRLSFSQSRPLPLLYPASHSAGKQLSLFHRVMLLTGCSHSF